MIPLKLALDWTPNVNHLGFLLSKELGFYAQEDIELVIINPKEDGYALTPGKKLELDMADFAIAPFETVISLNNKPNRVHAVAVYAILQDDLSCIATLRSSHITAPKLLDGKIYASYKARYEDTIVKELIKSDNGLGEVHVVYPEKFGIWNTLLNGKADATWIFDNWEGVEADANQIDLVKFRLSDYGIPYGYSPVVLAKKEHVEMRKETYAKFIKATQKGFMYAQHNPAVSVEILKHYVTDYDLQHINLEEAVTRTLPHYGNESTCGLMQHERVSGFIHWLIEKGLESNTIAEQELFTNELFA